MKNFWVVMGVMLTWGCVMVVLDFTYFSFTKGYPFWLVTTNIIFVVGGPLFLLGYFLRPRQSQSQ